MRLRTSATERWGVLPIPLPASRADLAGLMAGAGSLGSGRSPGNGCLLSLVAGDRLVKGSFRLVVRWERGREPAIFASAGLMPSVTFKTF